MESTSSANVKRTAKWTRRELLRAGAGAAALGTLGRTPLASGALAASELRIAAIGVGNRGKADLDAVSTAPGAKIVALCDVDSHFLKQAHATQPQAKTFSDYRQLFKELADQIDAVIISTPDHMHGAISLAAMDLDKHVYVQKPLAHNLAELRQMTKAAAQRKLVTQMGTQVHGESAYRTAAQALRDGAIGKVREAHSWIGRNLPLPATERPAKADPVPARLDWQLWQGVAPERPYNAELYHPFNWRMWRTYGCGMLGDMASHLFDPIFTGLGLKQTLRVESRGPANLSETFTPDNDVTFYFAGTPQTAETFSIRWTNGGFKPDASKAQLPAGVALPDSGSYLVGDKGVMVLPHWAMPTFYRDGKAFDPGVKPLPSVDHYHEWVAACRGEGVTSTPFSYAGVVTEAVLLGTVAGNFPKQKLSWDGETMKFDDDKATAMVHREYRPGWRPLGL